jgi:hypothetical protein
MFGIGIELGDAVWTAYEINNDKPRNLPISSLSAYAQIEIRSTGFDTNGLGNFSQTVSLETMRVRSNPTAQSALAILTISSYSNDTWLLVQGMIGYKSLVDITNGENLRYDVYFDSQEVGYENKDSLTANDLKLLSLSLPSEWQQHSPKIVGGFVRMTINGTIPKMFVIMPQTNLDNSLIGVVTNDDFIWRDSTRLRYFEGRISN